MAFLAAAIPYLAAAGAAGSVYAASSQHDASIYNAQVSKNEGNLSIDQASAQATTGRKPQAN